MDNQKVKEIRDIIYQIDSINRDIAFADMSLSQIDLKNDDGSDLFAADEKEVLREEYESDKKRLNDRLAEFTVNFDVEEAKKFVSLYDSFSKWNFKVNEIKKISERKGGFQNIGDNLVEEFNRLSNLIKENKTEFDRLYSKYLKQPVINNDVVEDIKQVEEKEPEKAQLTPVISEENKQESLFQEEIRKYEDEIKRIVNESKGAKHVVTWVDKRTGQSFTFTRDRQGKFLDCLSKLNCAKKQLNDLQAKKGSNLSPVGTTSLMADNSVVETSSETKVIDSVIPDKKGNDNSSLFTSISEYIEEQLKINNNLDHVLLSVGIKYGYNTAYEYFNNQNIVLNNKQIELDKKMTEIFIERKNLVNNMYRYNIGDYTKNLKEIDFRLDNLRQQYYDISKRRILYSSLAEHFKKLLPFESELLTIKELSEKVSGISVSDSLKTSDIKSNGSSLVEQHHEEINTDNRVIALPAHVSELVDSNESSISNVSVGDNVNNFKNLRERFERYISTLSFINEEGVFLSFCKRGRELKEEALGLVNDENIRNYLKGSYDSTEDEIDREISTITGNSGVQVDLDTDLFAKLNYINSVYNLYYGKSKSFEDCFKMLREHFNIKYNDEKKRFVDTTAETVVDTPVKPTVEPTPIDPTVEPTPVNPTVKDDGQDIVYAGILEAQKKKKEEEEKKKQEEETKSKGIIQKIFNIFKKRKSKDKTKLKKKITDSSYSIVGALTSLDSISSFLRDGSLISSTMDVDDIILNQANSRNVTDVGIDKSAEIDQISDYVSKGDTIDYRNWDGESWNWNFNSEQKGGRSR